MNEARAIVVQALNATIDQYHAKRRRRHAFAARLMTILPCLEYGMALDILAHGHRFEVRNMEVRIAR